MKEEAITVFPHSIWKEYKLTPDQYILLKYLFDKGKEVSITSLPFKIAETYLDDLHERDFILLQSNKIVKMRQKGFALFNTEENLWYEFISIFPHKVPARNGGFRPLRALNPDSPSNKKARDKYLKIIKGNKELHKYILNLLSLEIKHRKTYNQFAFMHNLETWLNQRDWEKFEFLLEEENTTENQSNYGEELI